MGLDGKQSAVTHALCHHGANVLKVKIIEREDV
jgi:hypothetical protein